MSPSQLDQALQELEATVAQNTADIQALKNAPAGTLDPTIGTRLTALEASVAAIPTTPDTIVTTLAAALSKLVINVNVEGSTTTGDTPPPTGGAVGSTTDTNVYPLTAAATDGPVMLGTGTDTLDLLVSNSPGQSQPCVFNVILTRADGSKLGVAGPLTCTSYVGQTATGAQHFSIKGPWGANPKFSMVPAAEGAGLLGCFLMGVAVDLVPFGIWSQDNSRGGGAFDSSWTYNSNNAPMDFFGDAAPVVVPVVFDAVPTIINGQTLAQMAGGTLPAQTIIGTARLTSDLTGAGIGKTIIDGTHLEPTQDKSLLLAGAAVTIQDLTVQHAWVSGDLGLNAAGIRNELGTIPLTVKRVELTANQNGILTQFDSVGPFNFDSLHVHGNGDVTHPLDTHNLYIGGTPQATLNLTNSIVEGSTDVHEVKSRCGTTIAVNNIVTTGGNGSCYDIPNGGIFNATNEVWTLIATADDRNFLTYGMENNNNVSVGSVVTLTGIRFRDLTGRGGLLQCNPANFPGAVLNLIDCTFEGPVPPQFIGWATVNGTVVAAAALAA